MRLINGSLLIIESAVRSGVEVYVGYPITPSNWLYFYGVRRCPYSLPAPDEITTLQWMSGLSASGRFPMTATSFPGFALMVESLNMAYMMELPMLVVLVQRLGPSTGSATTGAQGDVALVRYVISGGYELPVFSPSSFDDCWTLTSICVKTAVEVRTPVILLTSKEMVMTAKSFDVSSLPPLDKIRWDFYSGEEDYEPYKPGDNLVPPFLPVGNTKWQVRLTASTHDRKGMLQKATPEALENTIRLSKKVRKNVPVLYEYREVSGSDILVVSWGISAEAVRDAFKIGKETFSYLIVKTLVPVSEKIYKIVEKHRKILFVEENYPSLYRKILFGEKDYDNIYSLTKIGYMISPDEILSKVEEIR